MKTDRELLELAAKEAGYKVRWHDRWECFVHVSPQNIDNPPTVAGQRQVFSPLTDDGDALRLAVMIPGLNLQWIISEAWQAHDTHGKRMEYVRRAIVRAAAAIGGGLATFPTADQIREDLE